MAVEIIECEQGTPEWRDARRGIPTASCFHKILAKGDGKVRATYMRELAFEIITGELHEGYVSDDMLRGSAVEAEARRHYALMTDADIAQVGFIRNGRRGYSPDGLVGDEGLVEFKSMRGDLLIEQLDKDTFPTKHLAQCQGGLWVSERKWIDLNLYCRGLPPWRGRVERDEAYIKNLAIEVDLFLADLDRMVERIRSYGQVAA